MKARIAKSTGEVQEEVREQVMVLDQRMLLDDEAMEQALLSGRNDFVIEALALRAEMEADLVRKIIATSSAKSITALAWKAGLSMRTAIQIQSRTGHIPPKNLLNARHGTDYPLSEAEMIKQIGKFL